MQTLAQLKTSDKVKASLERGFSIVGLAKMLELSRPTVYKRLEDNTWSSKEIETMKSNGIIR